MAGLDQASRSAITKLLQEWREAYDEYAECQARIAALQDDVQALEARLADAFAREESAKQKFMESADAHSGDPKAVDEINAIVDESVKGIMGVAVVSGGGFGEQVFE